MAEMPRFFAFGIGLLLAFALVLGALVATVWLDQRRLSQQHEDTLRTFQKVAAESTELLDRLVALVKLPLEMGVLSFVQNVDKELRNGGKASTCGIHAGI